MEVYLALHNPDTNESGPVTLSVHKTKKGAKKVIGLHKAVVKRKHREYYPDDLLFKDIPHTFDQWKWWGIKKVELKE